MTSTSGCTGAGWTCRSATRSSPQGERQAGRPRSRNCRTCTCCALTMRCRRSTRSSAAAAAHRLRADVLAEAIGAVRELDAAHLRRVGAVRGEFYEGLRPHDRPVIAGHRADVTGLLAGAAAVVVAGGHVGVLADALHLFNIAASLRSPVIAWSAGAMALTDRIVLFNDRAPQGPGHPEVYGSGLLRAAQCGGAAARQRQAAARRRAPDGRLRPQVRARPAVSCWRTGPGWTRTATAAARRAPGCSPETAA